MTTLELPTDALLFVPLGGSGEIGMNLNLYGLGGKWIMADLGISFADERLPGIDVVMPEPRFIEERAEDLLGIIITHAHEDHYGAVAHLWPRLRAPVFATPFTAELLRGKLAEAGLEAQVPLNVVPLGGRLSLGPFDIEYIRLTHSIPESNALSITTPLGRVMHTGDWKLDRQPLVGQTTDEARLQALGDDGVLAMVCDSTNVFNAAASGSEGDVRESLTELIAARRGGVAVATFASNVARIETVAHAARRCGRQVALVGRSMQRTVRAARAVGYLEETAHFLSDEEGAALPRDKVVFLCTGSQGEARGATSRIAAGDHPHVSLGEGDCAIFSSKIIPGNELRLAELHNTLALAGVEIITEKNHFVHVSGHPGVEELVKMYQWVRPQIAVSVHGEARHLIEHRRLAHELQIAHTIVPQNGTVVRLAPGPAQIIGAVPAGRLVVDGERLVPDDGRTIVERRRLLFNGHVVVSLVIDEQGRPVSAPRISAHGIPMEDGNRKILEDAITAAIKQVLEGRDRGARAGLGEALRIGVRRTCRALTGKRPIVDIHLIRLEKEKS